MRGVVRGSIWSGCLGGLAMAACLFGSLPALALDGIVEKKVFEMPSYTTTGGGTIKNVRIGWESYGKLNEAKDNVILITHFFSGSSHAAGKYKADDAAPPAPAAPRPPAPSNGRRR